MFAFQQFDGPWKESHSTLVGRLECVWKKCASRGTVYKMKRRIFSGDSSRFLQRVVSYPCRSGQFQLKNTISTVGSTALVTTGLHWKIFFHTTAEAV